jgi:hypothetical protein
MPKVKKPAKKKNAHPKTAARKPASAKKPVARSAAPARAPKPAYTEEYADYLQRYAMYGTGRPHLSPADFDRLDDEMLDLLGIQAEIGLNDDQIVRLQELEFLLLDSEQ